MARLDPQIASNVTVMLWQQAARSYGIHVTTPTEDNRATLNKITRCLATMLDTDSKTIGARIRDAHERGLRG